MSPNPIFEEMMNEISVSKLISDIKPQSQETKNLEKSK